MGGTSLGCNRREEDFMNRRLFLIAGAAVGAVEAVAQTPPGARIADVAWMAGRWTGEGLGGTLEETWAPPTAGMMVGHFQLVRAGRPVFYELMQLYETPAGVDLRVKHVNPDFTAWEEKADFVRFAFQSATAAELRFNGLAFSRQGDNAMTAVLRLRYGADDVRDEILRYRRAPL
jgi:hypothetical protein